MSWFTNLLVSVLSRKGVSESRSFLKNQAGSLLNKYTGAGLTGAEQEANQFTAEQMDLANQRNVFNYQNRYQWETADMEKAGLNPALLYGGSSGAGSVGSASAGSSVSPASNGISDLIGSIMDIALLKAQIGNINADTALKKSESRRSEVTAENIERLTPLQEKELTSRIKEINQNVSESEARQSLSIVQTIAVSKNTKWYDKMAQADIDLQESQKALNDAMASESKERVGEIKQRIANLKQEVVESFARMAVYSANAGYLDQQTLNAMEEQKLIEVRRAGARTEYLINEKVLANYDTDKWFIRAQQGMSAARDLGIGVSSIASGGLFSPIPRKIGY